MALSAAVFLRTVGIALKPVFLGPEMMNEDRSHWRDAAADDDHE